MGMQLALSKKIILYLLAHDGWWWIYEKFQCSHMRICIAPTFMFIFYVVAVVLWLVVRVYLTSITTHYTGVVCLFLIAGCFDFLFAGNLFVLKTNWNNTFRLREIRVLWLLMIIWCTARCFVWCTECRRRINITQVLFWKTLKKKKCF